MRLTGARLAVALGLALSAQAGVFAWRYQDLIYFRQPVAVISQAPADEFERYANEALNRSQITRQHLDTIADAAVSFQSPVVELRALERAVKVDPTDARLKMRLADALRRSGNYKRAEALYLEALKSEKGGVE